MHFERGQKMTRVWIPSPLCEIQLQLWTIDTTLGTGSRPIDGTKPKASLWELSRIPVWLQRLQMKIICNIPKLCLLLMVRRDSRKQLQMQLMKDTSCYFYFFNKFFFPNLSFKVFLDDFHNYSFNVTSN